MTSELLIPTKAVGPGPSDDEEQGVLFHSSFFFFFWENIAFCYQLLAKTHLGLNF